MSDRMRGLTFTQLLDRMEAEYSRSETVFGVTSHRIRALHPITLFEERLDNPFGVAAGPHTQLAQNIVTAYAAGCRYFELKTVQALDGDELTVNKPCILAEDEGYNVEWSTELTVPQAFEEYVKAWFILKLMSLFAGGDGRGFIFNMSVGYDLAGIKGAKLNSFIDGMMDASDTQIFNDCLNICLFRYPQYAQAFEGVRPFICRSVTLSTLHGCPAIEIERIAEYLIKNKGLNTFIKLNPTLLGYEYVRSTLDSMGYDYIVFDKRHFSNDLQYSAAIPMIDRLMKLAGANGLEFGVKLTNTFPVEIMRSELPGSEMYMSGKALYPLATAVAEKLAFDFNGKLRISYSGGADANNIAAIANTGIYPITVATTLLKAGGYARCKQLSDLLLDLRLPATIACAAVRQLHLSAKADWRYQKPIKPLANRKIARPLPLWDCMIAPCALGCPFEQDIPEYIHLIEKGRYTDALRLIIAKNPLPFITGSICSHRCMEKCTRNHYDEPVCIRSLKLAAAEKAYDSVINDSSKPNGIGVKVAVIGGGPAGLAAAYLLGKRKAEVTLFEKTASLGGVVRHIIPEFRIKPEYIDRDIALATKYCNDIRLNTYAPSVDELFASGYAAVVIAIGAEERGSLSIDGNVINGLDFLSAYKRGEHILPEGSICVIGGGNTAMDAARAALREKGVSGVSIVYRRTKRYMPADAEEFAAAINDGAVLCELLSPIRHEAGLLYCKRLSLDSLDSSGRMGVSPTGEAMCIPCAAVISAIGQSVDESYFIKNGISRATGLPTYITSVKNVYRIGDCKQGVATIADAIADAGKVVDAILGKENSLISKSASAYPLYSNALARHGVLQEKSNKPAEECKRCLACSTVCESCVDVCPNRANIPIRVPGKNMRQILHIEELCNECGNCATFCPYSGLPYRDKFTLFASKATFMSSSNSGFYVLDALSTRVLVRINDCVKEVCIADCQCLEPDVIALITTIIKSYSELL